MAAKRPRRNVPVAKGLAAKRPRRIGRGETVAAKRSIPGKELLVFKYLIISKQ
jgi:hypothetical protein